MGYLFPFGGEPNLNDMNDFEKAVSEQDSANPTPVSQETESSVKEVVAAEQPEVCAATESHEQSPVAESEEKETLETPRVNYHSMSKDELVEALKSLLEAGNMEAHKEVAAMKQAFFAIRSRESMEEVNAYVEAGNDPATYSSTSDEAENEFKRLYAEFKEKRNAYIAADEARRKENLAKKQEILADLTAISQDIDTVNTKFSEFQQLQQDFKAIKDVPAQSEAELWKEFQNVTEQFYDHLKMNKELRDLDFKKNLEAKKLLISDAKALETMSDPVSAFRKLQLLHDEWRNIGPVAKELREDLWNEFKDASTIVNKRHQDYFEQRKAAELENEEAKTALCAEAEAIDTSVLKSYVAWNDATEKLIDIQRRWKEYGFASKKVNAALYSRFRKACDLFFEAKTSYFQKMREDFNANLTKKTELCEKAEALKDLADLNKAAAEVAKLQAEWKTAGPVPRKQSDAIWQRFQTACNYFYTERKKQNSARRQEEGANLEAKRAIIAKLKELPLDGVRKTVIAQVKELQNEWQKIGYVPFKLKDKVYAEYREVVDLLYNTYDAKESRNRVSSFKERVSDLKGDSHQIGRERERLVRAYEARRNEIKTIENNMGFFNVKSSAGNSMLKEMENKVNRLKEDMKEIEQKIEILDAQN